MLEWTEKNFWKTAYKKFEGIYGLLKQSSTNFTWSILECFDLFINNYLINYYSFIGKRCPYSKLFWSLFSCIRTEYGKVRSISPYSVWMPENTDQNNSKYEHFSRSASLPIWLEK